MEIFKKTLFKKIFLSVLGFIISVLSFWVIIDLYSSEKVSHTFVYIFFVLALFSIIVCIFYTFYAIRARRLKGFKGIGYIVLFVYIALLSIIVIGSMVITFNDIYSHKIFSNYKRLSLLSGSENYSGYFLFSFVVVIITMLCFTVYYIVDFVLTLRNLYISKFLELSQTQKQKQHHK